VSLALNLLVVGLVAGAMLGGGPRESDGRTDTLRTLGLGPFALALPRDERAELVQRLDRAALRVERREIGAAMRALQVALRSDPFDRDRAEAALLRARGAAERVQAQGHAALLDQLQAMTPQQRADLAERLSRALRRMAEPQHRP